MQNKLTGFLKRKRGLLASAAVFGLFMLPALTVYAIAPFSISNPIVPTCPPFNANGGGGCGFDQIIELIRNIIDWLTFIAFPMATLAFMYAGFLITTAGGDEGRIKEGKEVATGVAIGFALILSAWAVVYFITHALLATDNPFLKSS